MISVKLKDGTGSGNYAKINGEGELNVVVHPHPPLDETISPLPYRQYFTSDGTASGSSDMRVNGATTPQKFSINAQSDKDIFIKTLSIQISDNGASLDNFGALTALTNGVKLEYFSNETGALEIHEGIKDNLTFLRIGNGYPTGSGASAFRADISGGGGTDTYFMRLDLASTFGLAYGVRLIKGSTARLQFVVQDNLSVGIDQFDVIGYGITI